MKKILCITLVLMIVLPFTAIVVSAENNGFIKVEAEYGRVIALKDDGTVWVWGNNINGFLCDGTSIDRYAPVKVEGVENIVDIAMSWWHTALLAEDGTMWYWGNDGDFQTDLGEASHIPQKNDWSTWIMVKGNSDSESEKYMASDRDYDIMSGISEQLVIKEDGTVWLFKFERYYDGDIGEYLQRNEETFELKDFVGARDVAIDNGAYYIVCADGSIVSKGDNYSGQLGNGFSDSVSVPLKIDRIVNAKKVCSTNSRYDNKEDFCYYILHMDGTVSMYDYSDAGSQITNIPIENVANIVANEYIVLALKDDGTVWTWEISSHDFNVRRLGELNDVVSISV